ncbi:hypothetical protein [Aestuariivita sp.]|jgi:hypothetical protein|uniref:hypothetical protein n=1 Tax=Aestuariivita sp. TaxID=1872407 RepID=UPI0021736BC0|nr:hypothetical protein [Aestuariivita sp.]MCE8005996.1 hypothetical protein [Aestuariivita sp.]
MELDELRFSTAQVAQICDIPKEKFQLWNARYCITGKSHQPEGGGAQGKARRYTFRHVMDFAIAKALVDAGMNPKEAFAKSPHFAHFGSTDDMDHLRVPGLPMHQEYGDTLMIVGGIGHWIGCHNRSNQALDEAMGYLGGPIGDLDSFVVVNASKVFGRVCRRLGLHPFEVLDERYRALAKA